MASSLGVTRTAIPETDLISRPLPPEVPVRNFDAYAFLTVIKTCSDVAGLYALIYINFRAGFVVGILGFIFALLLRVLANCFLVLRKVGPLNAVANVLFGLTLGFANLSSVTAAEEIILHRGNTRRNEIIAENDAIRQERDRLPRAAQVLKRGNTLDTEQEPSPFDDQNMTKPGVLENNNSNFANFSQALSTANRNSALPPASPRINRTQQQQQQQQRRTQRQSSNVESRPPSVNHQQDEFKEALSIGPRTLTAMAEVVQQGFVLYPMMITFLDFGFGRDVDLFPLILVSAFFGFTQIMCWLVSPYNYKLVAYNYVYFATWLSFTLPFLLLLLLATVFNDASSSSNSKTNFDNTNSIDSFYTHKEVYAWTKMCFITVFAVIGISVFNNRRSRIIPPILYFQSTLSYIFFGIELISLGLFLISKKAFFYQFGDVEEEEVKNSNIDAVVFTNVAFSGWLIIVAYMETITADQVLKEKKEADERRSSNANNGSPPLEHSI